MLFRSFIFFLFFFLNIFPLFFFFNLCESTRNILYFIKTHSSPFQHLSHLPPASLQLQLCLLPQQYKFRFYFFYNYPPLICRTKKFVRHLLYGLKPENRNNHRRKLTPIIFVSEMKRKTRYILSPCSVSHPLK